MTLIHDLVYYFVLLCVTQCIYCPCDDLPQCFNSIQFQVQFFIAIGLQNFQTNSTILQFPVTMRTGLIRVCVLSVFANNSVCVSFRFQILSILVLTLPDTDVTSTLSVRVLDREYLYPTSAIVIGWLVAASPLVIGLVTGLVHSLCSSHGPVNQVRTSRSR